MRSQQTRKPKKSRNRKPKLPMLCVQWGESSVHIAHIGLRKSLPTIRKQWHFEYEQPLLEANAEQLGSWLRAQFRQHGVPRQAAYVSVPRRKVATNSFPQQVIPGIHLAETVLLQAESRYPMEMSELVVDFVHQSKPQRSETQVVLTGSIPSETISTLQAVFEYAAIPVIGIGVGEFGLGAMTYNATEREMELSVLVDDETIEIVAARFGVPFLSRSLNIAGAPVGSESIGKLFDHVETKVIELGFPSPDAIRMYGPESASLKSMLSSRFTKVTIDEPEPSDEVRLKGLAASFNQSSYIDFLAPETPPDQNVIRRSMLIRVACLLAIAGLGLTVWLSRIHDDLDQQLSVLQTQQAGLQEKLVGSEETFAAAQEISRWDQSRVEWSDEINRILSLVGSNERCYLRRLQIDSLSETGRPSGLIVGLVREDKDALGIADRLVRAPEGYKVQPGPIRPSQQDPHYQATFDLKIEWDRESRRQMNDDLREIYDAS